MSAQKKFRIAVTGATSPTGKALTEVLPTSKLAGADIRLLGDEDVDGTLAEYDGGVELIKKMERDALEFVDIVFLCDSPARNREHMKLIDSFPKKDRPFVFELSGRTPSEAMLQGTSVEGLDKQAVLAEGFISTPDPLAYVLARFSALCNALAPVEDSTAFVLSPVSAFGSSGIESLHAQLVELMNFGDVPEDVFGQQLIFNVLPGMGTISPDGWSEDESDIAGQMSRLSGGTFVTPALFIHPLPVFYSYSVQMHLRFSEPIDLERIRNGLTQADGFRLDTAEQAQFRTGALGATTDPDVVVSRLARHPGNDRSILIWFSFDNVKTGLIIPALKLAEELFSDDGRLADAD